MTESELNSRIAAAEAAMKEVLRDALGSPTEQMERIEAIIDGFDRGAVGIDRSAPSWWRTAPCPR